MNDARDFPSLSKAMIFSLINDTITACPRPDRGATQNTPGMNTFSHNAFLKNKKRREGETCLNSVKTIYFLDETKFLSIVATELVSGGSIQ